MSKSVEVESIDSLGKLREIDARSDSWHSVRWGIVDTDASVAVDVWPHDEDMLPFRLRVLDREKAADVYEHPYGYLPGSIALVGAGVSIESAEAA